MSDKKTVQMHGSESYNELAIFKSIFYDFLKRRGLEILWRQNSGLKNLQMLDLLPPFSLQCQYKFTAVLFSVNLKIVLVNQIYGS